MAAKATHRRKTKTTRNRKQSRVHHRQNEKKIHPIIIYPFGHPSDTRHLRALFENLTEWLENDSRFSKPITVVNRQTLYKAREDLLDIDRFLRQVVAPVSEIDFVWAVDTCQMWLDGFGKAYDRGSVNDVFWLIPGDFHYANEHGMLALERMPKLPDNVYDGECELCIGEISVPPNSAKYLIDIYGTYGLLYNWFPAEAQGIRKITVRPRSEFLAIGHDYLKAALMRPERWYAYEQTIVILLQGMKGIKQMRAVKPVDLGEVIDDPSARSTLAGAMQQIERTERVLKLYWRELHEWEDPNWPDTFRKLDAQSEQIRGAAMIIMQQILSLQ